VKTIQSSRPTSKYESNMAENHRAMAVDQH
jgi:hypothetical protein